MASCLHPCKKLISRNFMSKPFTVIITGPTASGKTELSLYLARHFNAPVISADSRQCYKYLDIGTGKVSADILKEIPHYHISSLYPDQSFTASDFADHVALWRRRIHSDHKPVIIAGGSTLYIESIIRPLDHLPPKNEENIHKLQEKAQSDGIDSILAILRKIDPVYAGRIDGPNPHRLFRALDVWMQTGRTFSSFHSNASLTPPDNTLVFCIDRERTILHDRINKRVDNMISDGLLNEVSSILDMGYDPALQSLRTVGYREAIGHLQGDISLQEMAAKIKTNTRRYARRQLTWFRRWNGIHRINLSESTGIKAASHIINKVAQLTAHS